MKRKDWEVLIIFLQYLYRNKNWWISSTPYKMYRDRIFNFSFTSYDYIFIIVRKDTKRSGKFKSERWASLPKDSFLRIGRARKNNRINSTHSWLAGRSRLMPVSRGSAAATSRLHPETWRGAAAVISPLTVADDFVVVVVVVIRFVAMLGIFQRDSSIQSLQKWPYRDATRAFCDPRGRYLSALSSRRAVKGPLLLPQRWNAELIFTRRRLIPLVLGDSSRGTINWCMTEVIYDLPLVKVQSGRHDKENGSDKDNY